MKKDHSKCCDRKRIFPFRIATYLNDENKWMEATIYPDHIAGAYDSMDEQIKELREIEAIYEVNDKRNP